MPAWIPAAIAAAGSLVSTAVQNYSAKKRAREANKADEKAWREQTEYNTPTNQMQRLNDAGLNPHLSYTQASSGNMDTAPKSNVADTQRIPLETLGEISLKAQQAKLIQSQTSLNNQKYNESVSKVELNQAQKALTKANPYLNQEYMESFVRKAQAIADLKGQEANYMLGELGQPVNSPGIMLYQQRLNQILNQNNLMNVLSENREQDLKLTAERIKSAQFQNEIDQLYNDMMKATNVSGKDIMAFTKLLLASLARSFTK